MLKKVLKGIGLVFLGVLFLLGCILGVISMGAYMKDYIWLWKNLFEKEPKFDDILDDIDDVIGDED